MTIISQIKGPHKLFFGRLLRPMFNETFLSYTLIGSNVIFRISFEGKEAEPKFWFRNLKKQTKRGT